MKEDRRLANGDVPYLHGPMCQCQDPVGMTAEIAAEDEPSFLAGLRAWNRRKRAERGG